MKKIWHLSHKSTEGFILPMHWCVYECFITELIFVLSSFTPTKGKILLALC